ncbi:peroxiredoxin [Candidatus Dependentiae bacterium]|nr:peroxiredoxin [Candidatus Dependentiae bacterium]
MFKALFILFMVFSIFSIECKKTKKGSLAPQFSSMGDDGKKHSLADYKGKKVILYFYPKDDSAWCTQEAQGFRDHFEIFKKNNIEILGISCDSVETHKAFKAKHNLPFTLLSDPKSKIFKLYGAKGLLINSRISYLINESGIILHVFSNINSKTHAEDVLKYLGIKFKAISATSCNIN